MNDLLYAIALTQVPGIGDVHGRTLIEHYGSAELIFKARKKDLERLEGIGSIKADRIKSFRDFDIAESELAFIEKHRIQPLLLTGNAYPKRLLNCYDCPVILYYRGNADLNHNRIISIVGTRNNTEYGRQVCEQFVEELRNSDLLVVSGLAFGIDTIAHKAALKNNLPTVAVLAHGLDRIYPPQNKQLARDMALHGGLLTDSISNTKPDKQNFPKRNRIVAGIADAVVVIESSKKGGSLITAEIANGYNKDVFAIPGRINDTKSEGCNYLVKNNKAMLITGADDLLETMDWKNKKPLDKIKQRALFVDLSPNEKIIFDLILQTDPISIDDLHARSNLSSSNIASALLMLEMQQLIAALPGKRYGKL